MAKSKIKIGVLGGSFDPAHKGHLAISQEALKKLKLKKIIWAITKKNPLKKKSTTSLSSRINQCKRFLNKKNFIKIKFYEDIIKSNKTIDLINHLTKNSLNEIYFLMGADNLINFHKWQKWQDIFNEISIVIFKRHGYNSLALKSITSKKFTTSKIRSLILNKKNFKKLPSWTWVNNKEIKISSSEIRKQRNLLRG